MESFVYSFYCFYFYKLFNSISIYMKNRNASIRTSILRILPSRTETSNPHTHAKGWSKQYKNESGGPLF